MRKPVAARVSCVATLTISALTGVVPSASAAPGCPDVEVVFARGTGEPPGLGPTGEAFVDALRQQVGSKSIGVYPVSYPATDQWATGVDGIRDAGAHVVSTARSCPETQLVLGGFSQGAAVMGFVTSPSVPDGVDPATVPKPLQPEVADHVAALALFGMPNERAMNFLGEPAIVIGPQYGAKTIKLCAPEDPVCSEGLNFSMHSPDAYAGDLTGQGAAFAANHLKTVPSQHHR